MTRPRRIGLPWYRLKDYADLRARLADGARLPEHYEAWRVAAEQVEGEVRRSGVEVVRVPIEPDAFLAWCVRANCPSDGAARARFVAEVIVERDFPDDRSGG